MRNNTPKYSYVCVVDTIYTLFLYLILFNIQLEKTYFVFSSGIDKRIRNKFEMQSLYIPDTLFYKYINLLDSKYGFIRILFQIFANIYFKIIILLRVKNKAICYGHDHLQYSKYFIVNLKKMVLLEDGVGNYGEACENSYQRLSIRKLKNKKNSRFSHFWPAWGVSKYVESIVLTGILPVPTIIQNKVKIINLEEEYLKLSSKRRGRVINYFPTITVDTKHIEVLLLTQCYSEDGIISEQDKINIYRKIMSEFHDKVIYIKPHPRERTNYSEIFPNVVIIENAVPIELFVFLDLKIDIVATISSTGAYVFKNKSEVLFYDYMVDNLLKTESDVN